MFGGTIDLVEFLKNHRTGLRGHVPSFRIVPFRMTLGIDVGRIRGKGLSDLAFLLLQTKDGSKGQLGVQFLPPEFDGSQIGWLATSRDAVGFGKHSGCDGKGRFHKSKIAHGGSPSMASCSRLSHVAAATRSFRFVSWWWK